MSRYGKDTRTPYRVPPQFPAASSSASRSQALAPGLETTTARRVAGKSVLVVGQFGSAVNALATRLANEYDTMWQQQG